MFKYLQLFKKIQNIKQIYHHIEKRLNDFIVLEKYSDII